jgi:hypothetical protein
MRHNENEYTSHNGSVVSLPPHRSCQCRSASLRLHVLGGEGDHADRLGAGHGKAGRELLRGGAF